MKRGSFAVGQADVYQVAGTVMGHQTVWMTLMNTTAVSYSSYYPVYQHTVVWFILIVGGGGGCHANLKKCKDALLKFELNLVIVQ